MQKSETAEATSIIPPVTTPVVGGQIGGGGEGAGLWAWTVLRILLGWSFIWAFLDKLFGLGFATCRLESGGIDFGCDAAMISGGSPTYGFLTFGTQGSHLGEWFDWMGSSGPDAINFTDWLFMAVLLLGGLSMMLGVAVRIGAVGSALLVFMMFLAGNVWPEHNPVNDSHIIETVVYLGIAYVGPGRFALQGWVDDRFPALRRFR